MSSSFVKCFFDGCISIERLSSTRLCIVCRRPVHEHCDASSNSVAAKFAEITHHVSHHLARSGRGWGYLVESRSRYYCIFVRGMNRASLQASQHSQLLPLAQLHKTQTPRNGPDWQVSDRLLRCRDYLSLRTFFKHSSGCWLNASGAPFSHQRVSSSRNGPNSSLLWHRRGKSWHMRSRSALVQKKRIPTHEQGHAFFVRRLTKRRLLGSRYHSLTEWY